MPSIVGMNPFSISCVSWNIFVFPKWMSVYKPYEPLPGRQRELNDLPITFPLSWTKSVPNFVPYPRIFSSKPHPGFRFSITLPSRVAAWCSGAPIFCLLFSLFLALIFLCIKSSSEKVCDWMNELIKSWWILKCIDIKLWHPRLRSCASQHSSSHMRITLLAIESFSVFHPSQISDLLRIEMRRTMQL